MAAININSDVTDEYYRYKMPKLIAKVEGKGNGIKTVIANMVDIAKALNRPPTYPTKFFGCELGAQTQIDTKNERYIVNGAHEAEKLQSLLDGFIRKFVLCPACGNPETDLKVRRDTIKQRCKACGNGEDVVMNHRLCTFIVKNPPPDQQTESKSGPSGKGKKERKGKNAKNGGSDDTTNGYDVNGETAGAHGAMDEPELTPPEADEDGESDWEADGVTHKSEELTDAVKKLTVDDDVTKTEKERADLFFKYLQKCKKDDNLKYKMIKAEADRLDILNKAPMILVEVLLGSFKDAAGLLKDVQNYRIQFLAFTQNNPRAQRYLVSALELLINQHSEVLLPYVSHLLKQFYDLDIIEEETLLDWHERKSKKFVSKDMCTEIHKKAEPFIQWLKQAEEATSSEEDGEGSADDGDAKKDAGAQKAAAAKQTAAAAVTVAGATNGVAKVAQSAHAHDDDEEDINIDDI